MSHARRLLLEPLEVRSLLSINVFSPAAGLAGAASGLTVNNTPAYLDTQTTVSIDNLSATSPVNEGSPTTLSGNFTNPSSADTHTVTIQWNDPNDTAVTTLHLAAGVRTFSAPHVYINNLPNNAPYTINVTVADDTGPSASGSTTVTVNDVPPTVALSGAATSNEGAPYSLQLGAIVDPAGALDAPFQVYVDWGDSSLPDILAPTDLPTTRLHTYGDNATVTAGISVRVIDADGLHVAGTLAHSVLNVPPTATSASNTGPVGEGSSCTVSLNGPYYDPSAADTTAGFHFGFDFNNDGNFSDPGEIDPAASGSTLSSAVVPGAYLQAPSSTVRMVIQDQDGGQTSYTTTVAVNNIAPVVNAGADGTAFVGVPFAQSGTFTDPGTETWTVNVWYGDGNTTNQPADQVFTVTNHNFSLNHTYAAAGNYTITVKVDDGHGGIGSDTVSLVVHANTFRVIGDPVLNASGFDLTFNRAADLPALNVYDGLPHTAPLAAADVTLVGSTVGAVQGSIVWDAATNTVSFVKTGGVLAPDTYTLALRSAADGWHDTTGSLLDGDTDYAPGGDYSTTFTVTTATGTRVVSLPDFARGAGQNVIVPASGGTGLPIKISDATGVTSVDLNIEFDPTLLSVTNAALAPSLPTGWTLQKNLTQASSGLVQLSMYGSTALSGSDLTLINLTASVPNAAPYGDNSIVKLTNVRVNEVALPAKGDYAIEKAAFLGDADGNQTYTPYDAGLIARAGLAVDSGFAAGAWTDPRVLGDTTGDGTLAQADALAVFNKWAGLSVPQIPALPTGITIQPGTPGVDPQLSIPSNIPAVAGGQVEVPVNISFPSGQIVISAAFDVHYDPSLLSIAAGDVSTGTAWPAPDWTIFAAVIAPGDLRVGMFYSNTATPPAGEIAKLRFTVGTVSAQTTPLHFGEIVQDGGLTWSGSDGSVQINTTTGVVNRLVFYNNSLFDGNSTAINAADDAAIAPDKVALLPGGTATFANYTSYSKGINGVMIDINHALGTPLTAADFVLNSGNDALPGGWPAAPVPSTIQVRPGAGVGGADRVELVWNDSQAVKGKWLMVKVLSDAHGGHAGLAQDDVFYFGNAVGETGNTPADAAVNGADEAAVAANKSGFTPASISNPYDFDRDRRVNATDVLIARDNATTAGGTALNLITVPLTAAPQQTVPQSLPPQNLQLTSAMTTELPPQPAIEPSANTAVPATDALENLLQLPKAAIASAPATDAPGRRPEILEVMGVSAPVAVESATWERGQLARRTAADTAAPPAGSFADGASWLYAYEEMLRQSQAQSPEEDHLSGASIDAALALYWS